MSFIILTNYILVDKKSVRESDVQVWGEFFGDDSKRRVKTTIIDKGKANEVLMSTVFLGVDHFYGASKEDMQKEDYQPLIFETMTFSDDHKWNELQIRYETWDESMLGHANLVKEIMRDRVKFKRHRAYYL